MNRALKHPIGTLSTGGFQTLFREGDHDDRHHDCSTTVLRKVVPMR